METQQPVTSIVIVAQSTCRIRDYTIINRTNDNLHDADLCKGSRFPGLSRSSRYLAISRKQSDELGNALDVVTDLMILRDREKVPLGYHVILKTADTNEKSLKKWRLCVKMSPRATTTCAVTNVVVLSGKTSFPPDVTKAIEVYGIYVGYMMAMMNTEGALPPAKRPNATSGLPRLPPPPPPPPPPPVKKLAPRFDDPETYSSISRPSHPLSYVPFALNAKYTRNAGRSSPSQQAQVKFHQLYKSASTLTEEYECDFSIENSVIAASLEQ